MLLRSAWMATLAEQLFADNEFLNHSLNWDEYVRAGYADVTIPQSGGASNVVRNRSVFPAQASERADGDIKYTMVDYTSDPRRIRNLTQKQYSYDYRGSILRQDSAIMKQFMAEDILYTWRAEQLKFILRTTGDDTDVSNGILAGTRKKATMHDFLRAEKALTDAFIPKAGRLALISTQTKLDLLTDPKIEDTYISKDLANYKEGEIVQVGGFSVMVRPSVLTYNGAGTQAKLPGTAQAANDNDASLFWHPNFVGRSMGNMDIFYNPAQATSYGDLFSTEAQAGGAKFYDDGRGVIVLVQKA